MKYFKNWKKKLIECFQTPTAEGEKDGSTSESSLESSSGYGSQTTFPVEDASHPEGKSYYKMV